MGLFHIKTHVDMTSLTPSKSVLCIYDILSLNLT